MRDRRGAYAVIRTASPLLRLLFEEARYQGFTNETLAARIGCAENSVSRWRAGRSTPGLADTEALAQALDFTLKLERVQ